MAGRAPRSGEELRSRRRRAGAAGHMGGSDRPAARTVRVAYYSPLPPERSGIADYSALLLPTLWETRAADFPLTREILMYATGVIVHSRFVEGRVREYGYRRPVWVIPHPAWPRPQGREPSVSVVDGSPIIVCAGNLTPSKRIPQL